MLDSQKDMLLKGVCCLMLLQINGEAKGHTQICSAQKSFTHLEGKKGFPIDLPMQTLQREALPSKNEIVLESDGKGFGGCLKSSAVRHKHKKGTRTFALPFIQRKMNMRSDRAGKKSFGKTTVLNTWKQSAPAFQWKRVSAQRGGKPQLNRSVISRNCIMAHFQAENEG